jgi:hypothetical protein
MMQASDRLAGCLLVAFALLGAATAQQGFISTLDGAQHECVLKRPPPNYPRALEDAEFYGFYGSGFCLARVGFSYSNESVTIMTKPMPTPPLCLPVSHLSTGAGPGKYRVWTTTLDPIAKLIALLADDKVYILNATSAQEISRLNAAGLTNFLNFHFDYTTHRLYGQYYLNGTTEKFVEIQYQNRPNATLRSISTINLNYKKSGPRTIDYHKGIFYLFGSEFGAGPFYLIGLNISTGAEVSRSLPNVSSSGRLFFDDATRNLIMLCQPGTMSSAQNYTLCKIDPVTGAMAQIAPGSETFTSWDFFGDSSFDAGNQLYYTFAPNMVALSSITGRLVGGPWTASTAFVAMTKFQCVPVTAVNTGASAPTSLPAVGFNQSRFAYPECVENRTWPQLSKELKAKPGKLSTGGLGSLATEEFDVWACFPEHPCLSRVQNVVIGDAMCYTFSEKDEKWYPWCLESEIQRCPWAKV